MKKRMNGAQIVVGNKKIIGNTKNYIKVKDPLKFLETRTSSG